MNAYDRIQKIDDYLENNMSNEEKKEFERLLSDPSASLGGSMNLNVKEEVKMQKAIIQEIQRRALRDTLMDENRRYRARQRVIPMIITLSSSVSATAIAAVMVIMFVISPMATLLKVQGQNNPFVSSDQLRQAPFNHISIIRIGIFQILQIFYHYDGIILLLCEKTKCYVRKLLHAAKMDCPMAIRF